MSEKEASERKRRKTEETERIPRLAPTAGTPEDMGPSPIPRYLLRIQYDGTAFHGFQRQANARSVQGCVEDALTKFTGGSAEEPIKIVGSSRTDAGVHALDATAHVDLPRTSKRHPGKTMAPHKASTVMKAVNHFLRRAAPDACVAEVVRVNGAKFHARYSATGRTYHYRMHVSEAPPSIFERGRVWHVAAGNGTGVLEGVHDTPGGCPRGGRGGDGDGIGAGWGLDIDAMRDAASRLLGTHDFSSFRANGCQANSPVRTLTSVSIEQTPNWPPFSGADARTDDLSGVLVEDEEEDEGSSRGTRKRKGVPFLSEKGRTSRKGTEDSGGGGGGGDDVSARAPGRIVQGGLVLTFEGPSFLYHQVRLMVATLRAVGAGEIAPDQIQALLDAKNPNAVPAMAPACGLYLARVHYDGTREFYARD